MNHNTKYIKVEFYPRRIWNSFNEDSDDSDCDSIDSQDEDASSWPQLKAFMEPKGWILEGNRYDLEKELEEALGGSLWEGKGWYQDLFIIRYINSGFANYIN